MSTLSRTVSEASSPPSSSVELPGSPLFDDPDADIVLRSCDNHEFRVLKYCIIKVSPVLCGLIQSASSSHAVNATPSLPSIRLSDNGATLSCLLTFVLPLNPVPPSTIEQTMLLLSAAQKYQMDPILTHIRAVVASQDPPFIRPETAFRVYTLAQKYGLSQEALHAARTTLTFSFTLEDLEGELDTTPGIHLQELWKYYQRVRAHLTPALNAFRVTGVPSGMASSPCNYGTLNWLGEYFESIARSPALFDITEFHMFLSRHANTRGAQCKCANIPSDVIQALWTALTNVVHSCMTEVSIDGLRNQRLPVIISMLL